MTTFKQRLKKLGKRLLGIPPIASCLASARVGSFTRVHCDEDADFIYTWGNQTIVQDRPDYNPLSCNENLDLFFFDYTPQRGDTVVLIGVENGPEIPAICSLVGTDGRVIAVEPTPSCVRRLKKLKSLLKLSQLVIVECAAGFTTHTAHLIFGESDMSNIVSLDTDAGSDGKTSVSVPVLPLPAILRPLNVETVDYCKINVEGAEIAVIQGIASGIEEELSVKNFCISAHDFLGPRTRTFDQVIDWLLVHSYQVCHFPYSSYPWRNYYIYGKR